MISKKLTIQEYLSLGYVYLILLGLTTEVIYYKFLGVSILNYSSILDVLIAPLNILTRDAKLFFFVLTLLFVITFSVIKLVPKVHNWSKRFSWYHRMYDMEKLDAKYLKKTEVKDVIFVFAMMLFGIFLGLSVGSAQKMQERIAKDNLKVTHSISFQNGGKKKVKIVGQNSGYIFYLEKGDKEVKSSPIQQNIAEIQRLPKALKSESND